MLLLKRGGNVKTMERLMHNAFMRCCLVCSRRLAGSCGLGFIYFDTVDEQYALVLCAKSFKDRYCVLSRISAHELHRTLAIRLRILESGTRRTWSKKVMRTIASVICFRPGTDESVDKMAGDQSTSAGIEQSEYTTYVLTSSESGACTWVPAPMLPPWSSASA